MAFWRRQSISEAQVIRAAVLLARTPPDKQVDALQGEGFSEGEAHRLIALLPLAFSRPVLEELGVTNFAPFVSAAHADGTPVRARLAKQPEYVAGLRLARKHRRRGAMDHEVYKLIAGGSADIDAACNALNAGESLSGSTVASFLIGPEIASHLICRAAS